MPQTISLGITSDSPKTVNKDIIWIRSTPIYLRGGFDELNPIFPISTNGYNPLEINIIKLEYVNKKIRYFFVKDCIKLSHILSKFICTLDPLMTYSDKFLLAHANYQAKTETTNATSLPQSFESVVTDYKSNTKLVAGNTIVLSVIGG